MNESQSHVDLLESHDSFGSMLLSIAVSSASTVAAAAASAAVASSYEYDDDDDDEVDDSSLIRTALTSASSSLDIFHEDDNDDHSSLPSSLDAATALSSSWSSSFSSSTFPSTSPFSPSISLLRSPSQSTRRLSSSSSSSSSSTSSKSSWFDVLAQILSSALLFLLIFGMSATVEVSHLREQVHNKFAILAGVSTQFLIMPLLGYLSVLLLKHRGLTEPMALSLLIVTASPGGSYSNWWCSMFNADLALSVTMTAISTLVSAIMLPANLLLYVNAAFGFGGSSEGEGGNDDDRQGGILKNIDWGSLFVSLAIVIVAIGLGLCASFKISSHRFNRFANRMGSLSGVLLILLSALLTSLSGEGDAKLWAQPWSFYLGVSLPCLVGLVVATGLAVAARLKKPEVVSVGVECCYQNVGICTSAVITIFRDPVERGQALCVPLFYGLMEAAVLGLYCIVAWKLGWTKAPRDEKFWAMIVTAYEVPDDDGDGDGDVDVGGGRDGDGHGGDAGRGSDDGDDDEEEAGAVVTPVLVGIREAPPRSPTHSTGNATTSEETWKSNVSNHSSSTSKTSDWYRWPWSLFSVFFRRDVRERRDQSQQSPHRRDQHNQRQHHQRRPSEIDVLTPPKRISLGNHHDDHHHNHNHIIGNNYPFLRDALESITEDGFGSPGSLVAFSDDKISYSRCRVSSEDSVTAITAAMSEDSPSHAASVSAATVDEQGSVITAHGAASGASSTSISTSTSISSSILFPRRSSSNSLMKGNF